MIWHGKNFRGIINKAKQMIFDNTGTNLQSTNAEDAIKEVNSKLASYSGTGSVSLKTLVQTLSNEKIARSTLVLDLSGTKQILHIMSIGSEITYGLMNTASSSIVDFRVNVIGEVYRTYTVQYGSNTGTSVDNTIGAWELFIG